MNSVTTRHDSPRLLDMVRREVRYRHYALSTEKAYVYWVRFYVKFHQLTHPREMGAAQVGTFLSIWRMTTMCLRQRIAKPYRLSFSCMAKY